MLLLKLKVIPALVLAIVIPALEFMVFKALMGLSFIQQGVTLESQGSVRIETVIVITSAIVGLATAYLRLYVGSEITKLKQEVTTLIREELSKFRAEFTTKELHTTQFQAIKEKVDELDRTMKRGGHHE